MIKARMLMILGILLMATGSFAGHFPAGWQKWSERAVPGGMERVIVPQRYQVFFIQEAGWAKQLDALLSARQVASAMSLPAPDGTLKTFMMWQDPIMDAVLAAKYPEIKTFSGYCVEDKAISIKADYSPRGFHAMVYNGSHTYFIDPYSRKSDGFYICYYKTDFEKPVGERMICEAESADGSPGNPMMLGGLPNISFKSHGIQKKTYRMALACTGEYAWAVAGPNPTKSAVLSAMVTTLNRVNGIYEREVAVSFQLVSQMDTLIFLHQGFDTLLNPYSNSNGSTMLSQNQSVITKRIGSNHYDIGHVFSTGGGGIASLRSVCNHQRKARGVTGSPNPVGDAFDVDYVCHEIGHQLGARHTFNSSTGGCGFGNGESVTAYEPGSGSTIMAYAGLCNADNLQTFSNDYFHVVSLEEMSTFISNAMSGGSCGTDSASGNTPPVVAPFTKSYFIPAETPFELTAPIVTDIDHDRLTYCWEQWNLGDFKKSLASTIAYGPIFRSYPPDTLGTRVFIKIDSLLEGKSAYRGERLPTVDRFLTFRLTVRDIYNGIGSFHAPEDTIHLDVISTGSPFMVTSPATPVTWLTHTVQTVTWDVATTNLAPFFVDSVEILLSLDGGQTFQTVLKSATANDGIEQITVPAVTSTTEARIKIKARDNVFFALNPQNFTITMDPSQVGKLDWEQLVSIFPIPARDVVHIFSDYQKDLNATVVDVLGRQIWYGQFNTHISLNVASWPSGVYFLHISNGNLGQSITRQLLIDSEPY